MALGPYPLISLVLAREKQADLSLERVNAIQDGSGINPAEKRREDKRGGEPFIRSSPWRENGAPVT